MTILDLGMMAMACSFFGILVYLDGRKR